MKQNIRLFLLLAVILVLSIGCSVANTGSGTTLTENASSAAETSSAEVSSKEVLTSSAPSVTTVSSESEMLFETEMSYAEYFSQERPVWFRIMSDSSAYAKNDGIYISEKIADGTFREKCIYEVKIEKHSGDNLQHVFFTTKEEPNSLYYYNANTNFCIKVLTANEEIAQIDGSWVALYFATESAIYRVHVPSKTVDYIMDLPKNFLDLKALSNQQIQYSVYRDDWLEYVKDTGDHNNFGQRAVAYYYNYNAFTEEVMLFETEDAAYNARILWHRWPTSEIMQNPYG